MKQYELKQLLQNICNRIANVLQRILEGYCKIVAINLQNLCKFEWFCKSYATTLQNFASVLQGILQKIATSLQILCKIFANFYNHTKLDEIANLHYFANNSLYPLGNGIIILQKICKNRMGQFSTKILGQRKKNTLLCRASIFVGSSV